jgi:hypothetical protein
MEKHNDLIGDASTAKELPRCFTALYDHVAVEQITEIKERQYEQYYELLHNKLPPGVSIMNVPTERKGRVRGFAVQGIAADINALIAKLDKLHVHFFVLLDDLLQKNRVKAIMLLPLGPHLHQKDIAEISRRVLLALSVD